MLLVSKGGFGGLEKCDFVQYIGPMGERDANNEHALRNDSLHGKENKLNGLSPDDVRLRVIPPKRKPFRKPEINKNSVKSVLLYCRRGILSRARPRIKAVSSASHLRP
jgi:hypothetical protein